MKSIGYLLLRENGKILCIGVSTVCFKKGRWRKIYFLAPTSRLTIFTFFFIDNLLQIINKKLLANLLLI
jgi:hypothetical protein